MHTEEKQNTIAASAIGRFRILAHECLVLEHTQNPATDSTRSVTPHNLQAVNTPNLFQAMFMRGRGHICHYCHTIDEAHYTRHHNIAEQLHSIYESCGEGDWPIVPSDSVDCERGREVDTRLANSRESNHGLALDDTLSSKRDKKDAKRLARAASRSRVITQEEIRYIDSVLHFAEGVFGSENDGPRNTDEIDEIEKHLRFNAHVYHNSNRRELKKFAQIPEADVDFDGEMERILDSFRISELVKRNTRTKGLQGKDLKVFQTLVFEFKRAVIDDLVLAKKDFLEVRMRRAGYLRYTHKTAYGIVEDRYSDRDWKTGERIQTSSSSESSGVTTPAELSVEGDISMLRYVSSFILFLCSCVWCLLC